jgi:hypothetical protein
MRRACARRSFSLWQGAVSDMWSLHMSELQRGQREKPREPGRVTPKKPDFFVALLGKEKIIPCVARLKLGLFGL